MFDWKKTKHLKLRYDKFKYNTMGQLKGQTDIKVHDTPKYFLEI